MFLIIKKLAWRLTSLCKSGMFSKLRVTSRACRVDSKLDLWMNLQIEIFTSRKNGLLKQFKKKGKKKRNAWAIWLKCTLPFQYEGKRVCQGKWQNNDIGGSEYFFFPSKHSNSMNYGQSWKDMLYLTCKIIQAFLSLIILIINSTN